MWWGWVRDTCKDRKRVGTEINQSRDCVSFKIYVLETVNGMGLKCKIRNMEVYHVYTDTTVSPGHSNSCKEKSLAQICSISEIYIWIYKKCIRCSVWIPKFVGLSWLYFHASFPFFFFFLINDNMPSNIIFLHLLWKTCFMLHCCMSIKGKNYETIGTKVTLVKLDVQFCL